MVDYNALCVSFGSGHDWSGDASTAIGASSCPHFGPWADAVMAEAGLAVPPPWHEPDGQLETVIGLLKHANVPDSWAYAIGAISECVDRGQVLWAASHALYGEVAKRLSLPETSRESAIALAYLVEATTLFESWVGNTMNAYNYIPMGFAPGWWPDYIDRIDKWVMAADLLEISKVAGGVSETESFSSLPSAERLKEIYALSPSAGVKENPSLPRELVNSEMETDFDLLFHPNADPEKSWVIISRLLESGDGEDLADSMREFDNMRDDGWTGFAGFAVDGPHAELLRGRIAAWADDNVEDDDEREEFLETLGFEIG